MSARDEVLPAHLTAMNGGAPDRVGLLLSDVVPERVDWIWRGRIPKGKLTICEGDPGVGKSAMTTDFFATALFARGEHPKVVQSLLGHSSITQTMDTYSHLMDGMGGDAVGRLDEVFG